VASGYPVRHAVSSRSLALLAPLALPIPVALLVPVAWRLNPSARGASGYSSIVARSLVIKVTAGKDEPERCNQAFTVAAAAVASGVNVSLWLTGESAWFALPGRASDFSLPHAAPLAELLASVLALGTVTVCTQCAARRDITAAGVIDGVRIAGAATFVAEIMADGTQALVY
jgi:predicted peroxiredoxin